MLRFDTGRRMFRSVRLPRFWPFTSSSTLFHQSQLYERIIQELVQDKRDEIQRQERLVQDKRDEIQRLVQEKRDEIQRLVQDKERILKEKDKLERTHCNEIARLNENHLKELSEYIAIIANRYAVELICSQINPTETVTKVAVNFCAELLTDKKSLTDNAEGMLRVLEPLEADKYKAAVSRELVDLYHEVSKPVHSAAPNLKGPHIMGKLPLRAALGLFVLHAQKEHGHSLNYYYTSETGKVLKVLRHGDVFDMDDV